MTELPWGSTASNLDSSQQETNTHHDQPTGTDWAPADALEHGYPPYDQYGSALTGYWPCDEGSGSVFADVSAAGNDMDLTNVSVGASGALGTTCGSYNGTDAYGEALNVDCNGTAYTATCWLNFTDHDDYARVLQSGGSPTSTSGQPVDGWGIEFDGSSHQLRLNHYSGSSGSTAGASNVSLSTDTWYYVVVRTRGGTNTGRLRIFDATGTEVDLEEGSGTRTTTTSNNLLAMMGDAHPTGGRCEEIRTYNRELTAAQEEGLAALVTNGSYVSSKQVS